MASPLHHHDDLAKGLTLQVFACAGMLCIAAQSGAIVTDVREGGQVTFGFRLTADLTRGKHLSGDEQGMEIELPAPIGLVTLRAGPGRMPTSEAQVFIFSLNPPRNLARTRRAYTKSAL